MNIGLMANWFTDLGRKVQARLGETWMIILLCIFVFMTLYLAQNVLRASINKTKITFKWGQTFFLIIFLLLTIWFITLL
ncbi:MAG: hypothetical protein J6K97_01680 [Clostridia bacterium]|nr:hypothetical protein [Clostridia bacterium]